MTEQAGWSHTLDDPSMGSWSGEPSGLDLQEKGAPLGLSPSLAGLYPVIYRALQLLTPFMSLLLDQRDKAGEEVPGTHPWVSSMELSHH